MIDEVEPCETPLNFSLDPFFAARTMRLRILADPTLQPDHFNFKKLNAEKLIEDFRSTDPMFSESYLTFIEIFEEIRASLVRCRLSASQAESIRLSATLFALKDGFEVFGGSYSFSPGDVNAISAVSVQNHRPFIGGDGNAYSGDDMLESTFDTLKAILDYCAFLESQPEIQPPIEPDLRYLFRLFNQFRVYKSDWHDCLHLGNELDAPVSYLANNAVQIGRPIGLMREATLRMQHVSFGGAKSIAVANHTFLDGNLAISRKHRRDFSKFRENMLDHVPYPYLRKLAQGLAASTVEAQIIDLYLLLTFISLGNMRKLGVSPAATSFYFEISGLRAFAASMLGVEAQLQGNAFSALTFIPGQKRDIWFTPLMLSDGKCILISPMLAQANFERFLEEILGKLPSIDTGKGFETYVHEMTSKAIAKAGLPFKTRGPFKAYGENSAFEEIDLLILAGSRIFVGEVKYDAFPADELSTLQHAIKMRKACEQASAKAAFLRAHWSLISNQIGWQSDMDAFVPFALTEKPFLNGLSFAGVPIIALRDFEDFFAGDVKFNVTMGGRGMITGGTSVRTFTNRASAAQDLETYLAAPTRRDQFTSRLRARAVNRARTPDVSREYVKFEFEVVG